MLVCVLGQRNSGQRPTHLLLTSSPESIAKQVPCKKGLYSKEELSVKTFLHDTKMMVSPTNLIVQFHLKIEKLEDEMHHFGKFCPQSYKKSYLNEMFKMLTLSPHLTFVHRSSAFSTAEMELGNWFSNVHHPDTNSCLILLLLTCANLAFLMIYNDRSFVKPSFRLGIVRPTCDGRSFASSPLRRLAS